MYVCFFVSNKFLDKLQFENKSSEFSQSFANGTMEPLPRSWLIMVSLARYCMAMVSLPRSCQDHGKILARLARNLPWILARVSWLRTLGEHYMNLNKYSKPQATAKQFVSLTLNNRLQQWLWRLPPNLSGCYKPNLLRRVQAASSGWKARPIQQRTAAPKPDCNDYFYKYACPRACGECKFTWAIWKSGFASERWDGIVEIETQQQSNKVEIFGS